MRTAITYLLNLSWVVWFVLVPFNSAGQGITSEELFVDGDFTHDRWTVEDGLPVNSINEIIQASDGYIWLGTFDGLARFDGVRFKVYQSAEYEGLTGNRIVTIHEAPDGTIWIKTEHDDVIRFDNGAFEHITEKDGLNGNGAFAFHNGPDDQLWIGAHNGISVYRDGELRPYHPERIAHPVSHVYVNRDGVLWYKENTELGLYRFDGEDKRYLATAELIHYSPIFLTLDDGRTLFNTLGHLYLYENGRVSQAVPGLPSDFETRGIYQDSTGAVTVASRNRGFFRLTGKELAPFNPEVGGRINGVLRDRNGNFWATGNRRLFINNRVVLTSGEQLTEFIVDREGSFWVGIQNAGLFRLKPNLFTIYSEEEGVPNGNIYPVQETSDGAIWFGTNGGGPVRLKDGALTSSFRFRPASGAKRVRSIVERANGDLLISIQGDGLYRFIPETQAFERLETPNGRPQIAENLGVNTLFEDSRRRLWAGTGEGLFVKKNATWEKVSDENGNPRHLVRYIAEAPDASLWMATNGGGILHYASGTFHPYGVEDGLSSNLVRSLRVDTTENATGYILWVGTEDKGLNRLTVTGDGPVLGDIVVYNRQNGLYDNTVHQILADDFNRFWMSGNQGIYRVSRDQLDRLARGEISEIDATGYTEQDGLRNREANGGIQPAGTRSSDGRLWFPTQDGLAMIDPEELNRNELPPPVHVEAIRSGGTDVPGEDNRIVLKAGQRNFEVAYTGLSFMVPDKVRFRYRLKGFDDGWNEAGNRRTAFYTNVPAGSYRFEVLAANNEGVWSPEPATASIEVLPYFYETTAFYVGLFVLAGLAVAGLIHLRTARLKRRETELETSVRERTLELEREKEKTEAQARDLRRLDEMKNRLFTNISHEFRTPLTLIISPLKRMLRNEDEPLPDEVVPELENVLRNSRRLQRLIDQILDLSKLDAGALPLQVQEVEMVGFTRKVTDLFKPLSSEKDQTLRFTSTADRLPLHVDPDAMEKILANLVSNAIKFTPPGGEITVELAERRDRCQITVRDSGVGIPPEKQSEIFDRFYQADASSTRAAGGTGIGLALVKSLVELHRGSITVDSEVGEGTVFTVDLKKGKAHFSKADIGPAAVGDGSVDPDGPVLSAHGSPLPGNDIKPEQDRPVVLVVEDNADMREFVASVLSESFSVLRAGDGEAALEMIREQLPDLIVSDIMMPNLDGMQLNEELKKDPMLDTIPVIFLTAKTESDSKLEGFRKGADDYLTKPFDADILAARVENIIRKRQQLRRRILEQAGGSGTEAESYPDPFLQRVAEVLERHFADPDFTIAELSEAVHMDRSQLYRRIKEASGESPQQFLSRFRMKKAARMLLGEAGTISEVAYATGFNSLSYFSKVFRRHYNMSPSDYQDRQSDSIRN